MPRLTLFWREGKTIKDPETGEQVERPPFTQDVVGFTFVPDAVVFEEPGIMYAVPWRDLDVVTVTDSAEGGESVPASDTEVADGRPDGDEPPVIELPRVR